MSEQGFAPGFAPEDVLRLHAEIADLRSKLEAAEAGHRCSRCNGERAIIVNHGLGTIGSVPCPECAQQREDRNADK